jgi:tetratricopeptide (TPR) repeat protein
VAYALNNLAEVRREEGRFDEAEELYDHAIALKQRTENVFGLAHSYASRADLSLFRGDVDTALRLADEAVELRVPSSDPIESARLLSTQARARLAADEPPGLVATQLEDVAKVLTHHDVKGELSIVLWCVAEARLRSHEEQRASMPSAGSSSWSAGTGSSTRSPGTRPSMPTLSRSG